MSIKLIALDVDGTLLNDDHELTTETKQAVIKAHQRGAAIVLCTGRSPNNTIPLMRELGFEGVLITHNGAATIHSEDMRILNQYPFALSDLSTLVAYCRHNGIHMDINSTLEIYVERIQTVEAEMYAKFMLNPLVVKNLELLKVEPVKFTIFGQKEIMDQAEQDWESIGCKLRKIRSGLNFLDIMSPQVNKGNALKQLAGNMGILPSETMAIGNYDNDLEMIEWAGVGIAMENSPEHVKASADYVTTTNNDSGVAKALSKWL